MRNSLAEGTLDRCLGRLVVIASVSQGICGWQVPDTYNTNLLPTARANDAKSPSPSALGEGLG